MNKLKRLVEWLFSPNGTVILSHRTKPQDGKPTHIIIAFKSQHTELLSRAESGMSIGQWKDCTLIWGEDVQHRQSRVFLNGEYAAKYMREVVAADDLKAQGIAGKPVFEERDGEPIIQLPDGSMGLADPMPRRMKAGLN